MHVFHSIFATRFFFLTGSRTHSHSTWYRRFTIFRNILIPINFHKFFGDILTKTSFCFTDDSMSSWGSGSSVLDLIFPQPETISEIRFRNWYTARLSILVRFDDSVQAPPKSSSLNWAAAAVSTSIVLMKIIYLYLLYKHM